MVLTSPGSAGQVAREGHGKGGMGDGGCRKRGSVLWYSPYPKVVARLSY